MRHILTGPDDEDAARRGLPVAAKPDSYDICFVADGDTRGFLARSLGVREGAMVSPDGEVLGTHQGYFGFTVGQRRGLGLTRPAPDRIGAVVRGAFSRPRRSP